MDQPVYGSQRVYTYRFQGELYHRTVGEFLTCQWRRSDIRSDLYIYFRTRASIDRPMNLDRLGDSSGWLDRYKIELFLNFEQKR
jgi:hypothetical protein